MAELRNIVQEKYKNTEVEVLPVVDLFQESAICFIFFWAMPNRCLVVSSQGLSYRFISRPKEGGRSRSPHFVVRTAFVVRVPRTRSWLSLDLHTVRFPI